MGEEMAGLYDRVQRDGLDGNGGDRVSVHLITNAISAYAGNVWSRQNILDAVNNILAERGSQPLRTEDIADIDAICDVSDGKATNTARLVYAVSAVEPSMIAAEFSQVTESQWRGSLEIQ